MSVTFLLCQHLDQERLEVIVEMIERVLRNVRHDLELADVVLVYV